MTNILTHRCGVSMISSAVIHVSWVTYLLRTRVPRPVANIHLLLLFTLTFINPLMGTLKPQSNGPLYSNTVIGTPAVDGWAVLLHFIQRIGAWAGCGPAQSPLFCNKCNNPPINGQCTNFILFHVAPLNSKGSTVNYSANKHATRHHRSVDTWRRWHQAEAVLPVLTNEELASDGSRTYVQAE